MDGRRTTDPGISPVVRFPWYGSALEIGISSFVAAAGCEIGGTAEDHLSDHKFKVGQSVNFAYGRRGQSGSSGIYKVTQLLPPEGDERQYRIKSAAEPHERVVKETEIERVA